MRKSLRVTLRQTLMQSVTLSTIASAPAENHPPHPANIWRQDRYDYICALLPGVAERYSPMTLKLCCDGFHRGTTPRCRAELEQLGLELADAGCIKSRLGRGGAMARIVASFEA